MVQRVQIALNIRGYDPGPVNGVLGLKTRDTLIRFQKDRGLNASGKMDTPTLEALEIRLP
jgi:peptidoglycan hydrolase-like protein with peptidoglycan-binding domain